MSMLLLPKVQVQVELRSPPVLYPAPERIVVSIRAEIFCDRASMVQVANETDLTSRSDACCGYEPIESKWKGLQWCRSS
jgi:hypothetical protein